MHLPGAAVVCLRQHRRRRRRAIAVAGTGGGCIWRCRRRYCQCLSWMTRPAGAAGTSDVCAEIAHQPRVADFLLSICLAGGGSLPGCQWLRILTWNLNHPRISRLVVLVLRFRSFQRCRWPRRGADCIGGSGLICADSAAGV